MGPKQETSPASAPTEVVVARILDDHSQILFIGKVHCSLRILRLPNVDTNGWDALLLAWDIKCDIQIARVDGTIREQVRFKVGILQ